MVMLHALSHASPSSSTNSLMSSATPIVGCVSFNWKHSFSGNRSQLVPWVALNLTNNSTKHRHHRMLPGKDILQTGTDKEVLLFQSELFAFICRIIGIQHRRNGFSMLSLIKCLKDITPSNLKQHRSSRHRRSSPH